MPDLKDLIPQPPWEGPPIPKIIAKSLKRGLYREELIRRRIRKPRVMYHITTWEVWESAQKEGLKPRILRPELQKLTGLQRGLYLTTAEEETFMYVFAIGGAELDTRPELKVAKLSVLGIVVPAGTTLVEDPEVSAASPEDIVSWIVDITIPPENIKLSYIEELTREEWEG